MRQKSNFVLDLSQINKTDLDLGKKVHILCRLKDLNVEIPNGFVITPDFFQEFLDKTGILSEIKYIKSSTDPALYNSLPKLLEPVRKKIMRAYFPEHLAIELYNFYRTLAGTFKESPLSIYSSSKNNQSLVFNDIKGDANLILKIKEIISYYLDQPFSIVVWKSIKGKDKKTIVSSDVNISDQNILKLARKIQKHFYFPQDLEYFIEKGKVFVTGIKPFTGIIKPLNKKEQQLSHSRKAILKGISLNPGIVTGTVKLINNQNLTNIKNSEIAVVKNLSKSLYSKVKKAKGVVTDTVLDPLLYKRIVKSPTIIAAKTATTILQNGNIITVNGVTGEIYSGGIM